MTRGSALLLIGALIGAGGAHAIGPDIATDPFVLSEIHRSHWEPGGKYFPGTFNSRGPIVDRGGTVGVVSAPPTRVGNICIQTGTVGGTVTYITDLTAHHPAGSHSPFDVEAASTGSAINTTATSEISVGLNWQALQSHPADAYDPPQGGGYPPPNPQYGAHDAYTFNIAGQVVGQFLDPQRSSTAANGAAVGTVFKPFDLDSLFLSTPLAAPVPRVDRDAPPLDSTPRENGSAGPSGSGDDPFAMFRFWDWTGLISDNPFILNTISPWDLRDFVEQTGNLALVSPFGAPTGVSSALTTPSSVGWSLGLFNYLYPHTGPHGITAINSSELFDWIERNGLQASTVATLVGNAYADHWGYYDEYLEWKARQALERAREEAARQALREALDREIREKLERAQLDSLLSAAADVMDAANDALDAFLDYVDEQVAKEERIKRKKAEREQWIKDQIAKNQALFRQQLEEEKRRQRLADRTDPTDTRDSRYDPQQFQGYDSQSVFADAPQKELTTIQKLAEVWGYDVYRIEPWLNKPMNEVPASLRQDVLKWKARMFTIVRPDASDAQRQAFADGIRLEFEKDMVDASMPSVLDLLKQSSGEAAAWTTIGAIDGLVGIKDGAAKLVDNIMSSSMVDVRINASASWEALVDSTYEMGERLLVTGNFFLSDRDKAAVFAEFKKSVNASLAGMKQRFIEDPEAFYRGFGKMAMQEAVANAVTGGAALALKRGVSLALNKGLDGLAHGFRAAQEAAEATAKRSDLSEITLGRRLGEGSFGYVDEVKGTNLVVKTAKDAQDGFADLSRQGRGYELARDADIATVDVHKVGVSKDGVPYMVMDKAPGKLVASGSALSAAERQAVKQLYDDMASKGLVWFDGSAQNMYFVQGPGGKVTAGILDHDLIYKASDWAAVARGEKQLASMQFFGKDPNMMATVYNAAGPIDARQVMQAMYNARYGNI